MSAASYAFRQGWFHDPECHRTTYRRRIALQLLEAGGVTYEWNHSDSTGLVGTGLMQRTGHVCDYRCRPVWPEWVTDEMFDRAYALANTIQTERAGWHHAAISRERAARAHG